MAKNFKADTGDLDARLTAAEERVKALHEQKDGEITGLNTLIEQTTEQINTMEATLEALDAGDTSDPEALSKMMDARLQNQRNLEDARAKLSEAQKMLKDCQQKKDYMTQNDVIAFHSDMSKLYAEYLDAYRTALQPCIDTLAEAAVQTEIIRLRINALTKSAGKLCKGQTGFYGSSSQLTTHQIKKWLALLEEFGTTETDIFHQAQEN